MSISNSTTNDWFLSAIIKDGSVGNCLAEVLSELKRKESFIGRLSERISEKTSGGVDCISDLALRISTLENTLKFRLSILSPNRRGAWFRVSASTASGPFAGSLLPDPIFSPYDEKNTAKIKAGLADCWRNHNLLSYPLKASESCLWKTLLNLNFELRKLGDMEPWPRLERLPEELPSELESRSLRAFLTNVRSEYLAATQRLDICHGLLWEASERFWQEARAYQSASNDPFSGDDIYEGHRTAEKMRQEFRSRRSTPTINRPLGKSVQDLEALTFMGFEDFPDAEALKHRYHSLAMEMHPDREGGNEARFKLLAKSYRHLTRHCGR